MAVSGDNTWVLWQLFIPSQNKISFTSQQCFKIQWQESTQVAYIEKLVPTNSHMGTDLPTVKLAIPLFEVCSFDGQFSECSPSECGPLLIIVLSYTTLPNTFNEWFHLEQLMYTAQVVTVGTMTPLFFNRCPCIPITESANKTNMYYSFVNSIFVTPDTGTIHE